VHTDFASGGALVSRIEMGAHIGTHVDAPLHVIEGAASIPDLPTWRFFGPGIALETPKKPGENIEAADFEKATVKRGDIVLFRTGWEERSGTPRFFQDEWPGFSPGAAEALLARGVKAVGLDSPSADGPKAIAAGFGSHKRLLTAGVPIFEALVNLRSVVGRRFFFIGLPLSIDQGEASPVRAIALLGDHHT
jgi:kynurenine formamidase